MIGNMVAGKRSLPKLNLQQLHKMRTDVQSKLNQAKRPNAAA